MSKNSPISTLKQTLERVFILFSKVFVNLLFTFMLVNATSHIIQAISMTVQRGNAISIMGTLGPLRKLEDFFDVISTKEDKL